MLSVKVLDWKSQYTLGALQYFSSYLYSEWSRDVTNYKYIIWIEQITWTTTDKKYE